MAQGKAVRSGAWAALLVAGFAAGAVQAQDSDADRLKKLEDQVKKQQEEIDKLKKAPSSDKPGDGGLSGSLNDGRGMSSAIRSAGWVRTRMCKSFR